MSNSRFHCVAVIGLLTLIAFAVRAAPLDAQSLWRDEVDALCYAFEFPHQVVQTLAPEAAGSLNTPCACPPLFLTGSSSESVPRRLAQTLEGMVRHNGPLYFFLLRGWVTIAGVSAYGMRFFSLISGVLCVPLVYVLGCRLFDRLTGFLAALLATASPYLTWYGQEAKMYTLVLALALLAIYGLRRASEGGGRRWWAVQIVASSLAFYSHVLTALLIPVQALLYLAWRPRSRRQWVDALVSLGCLTLPYLPLVVWQAPLLLQARETGFYSYTLGEMAEILLDGWTLGVTGRGWPWGAVLMGGLAVWGILSARILSLPRGEVRERLALVCWLTTPLLAVWLVSLRQPLFTDRYLIWTAPAFYLLVASGLASLWRLARWGRWTVGLVVSVLLVLNGVNLWQQSTVPIKSDFRAAAAYIAGYRYHHEPEGPVARRGSAEEYRFRSYLPLVAKGDGFNDLIIFQIPYGRYTFDYYFPEDEYPWAEGLYTNHRDSGGDYLMSEQDAAHRMQGMTTGYSTIWLVATEATMWDERGLVQSWLEVNGERVDEAHFMRVDVYRYVR